ncbi:hypothetical protein TRFO_05383 [Tritrichomonas foetus]|uniref:Symplekin C-terminal domain-containing protein n=1 Tax=Tritrichomonas foetus TaxID=1144522 RepID=A0A1J4KB82_9EUKA|nr:hypothetical protein TRFO_05383 [Tritrichomonas foetus]|eukprot:OHT06725.1 hypothetical protein TRFO_05383 [Tritrichomonas foetus]
MTDTTIDLENLNKNIREQCEKISNSPESIATILSELKNIINNQENFEIKPILDLCVHKNEKVRTPVIKFVLELNSKEKFKPIIEKFAIDAFLSTHFYSNPAESIVQDSLFFAIAEKDMNMLIPMIKFFGNSSTTMKNNLLSRFTKMAPKYKINLTILEECFKIYPEHKESIEFIHFILLQQSRLAALSPLVINSIKNQFEKTKDARFLIPILSNLKPSEFLDAIPFILKLQGPALKTFVWSLLAAKSAPFNGVQFLFEVHKIEMSQPEFKSAIEIVNYSVECKNFVNCQMLCTVIDQVARLGNLDLVLYTANKTMELYSESQRIILGRILPKVIERGICDKKATWEQLKNMLYALKPQSNKVILMLPKAFLASFLQAHPDIKPSLRTFAQTQGNVNSDIMQIINA